jgi:uncharacterized protein (TIGR02271 family)
MSGDNSNPQSGVIADAPQSDFYDNRHFDESRFFGNRRRQRQESGADRPEKPSSQRADETPRDTRREPPREPPQDMSIRKRSEARQASETAPRARDEVNVERRPVANADSASQSDIGEDEIRIPVYEDEIVVQKRRVLKEELVVKKNAVQDAQSAEGGSRKDTNEGSESRPRNESPPEERR